MVLSAENVINKRYMLSGKLGADGMGAVYRAADRLTGKIIALKRVTTPNEQLLFASNDSSTNLYLALANEFQTGPCTAALITRRFIRTRRIVSPDHQHRIHVVIIRK